MQYEFGALSDGRVPEVYSLQGVDGLRMDVTNYGGRVIRVYAPDRYGNFADVTLGWNTAAEYEKNGFCVGTLIGRYCIGGSACAGFAKSFRMADYGSSLG